MANPITTKQIYQDTGELKLLEKDLVDVIGLLGKLRAEEEKAAKAFQTSLRKTQTSTAAGRDEITLLAAAVSQSAARHKQYSEALRQNQSDLDRVKERQRQLNAVSKLEAQIAETKTTSYDRLNAQYKLNALRLKSMTDEERKNTSAGLRLTRTVEAQHKELRKLRTEVTGNIGVFGRLGQTLKTLFVAGGITGVITKVVSLFRDSARVTTEFKEQIAVLGAVSRATAPELLQLEQNAKKLGETTQFTAFQVAELQTNFARAGFNPQEIIDATEATLDLALATKTTLAEASLVVADNLRAYGLSAKDTTKFVDTLTAALNSSNITLESYKEASKELAPVSKVLKISAEESAAAIGILGDNGLKGTAATTTLASGLLKLSDDTKKYAKAAAKYNVEIFNQRGEFVGLAQLIKNLNGAFADLTDQQRLAALSQIFGIQSARVFATLMNSTKEVITATGKETLKGGDALEAYAKQLDRAGGSAAAASDKIGDTLAGDLKALSSAAEGAKINFISLFEDGIRRLVQGVTTLIGGFNKLVSIPLSEQLRKQQIEANGLVGALISVNDTITDANIREEARSKLISEIQAKYPDFLQNINLETASTQELKTALDRANDSFTKKIILQRQEEELNEIFTKRANLLESLVNLQQKQARGEKSFEVSKSVGFGTGTTLDIKDAIDQTERGLLKLDEQIASINERRGQQIIELNRLLGISEEGAAQAVDKVEQKIAAAGGSTPAKAKKAIKEVEEAAVGSVEYLRKQVEALKKELENATPENVQGILSKLVGAESALKEAEDFVEALRNRISGKGKIEIFDLAPIKIVKRTLTDIGEERKRLDKVFASEGTEKKDLFSLLGITVNDKQKQGLKDAFDFAKAQLLDYFQKRSEFANKAVEEADRQVAIAQQNLQTEIDLRNQQYANNVATAQKELDAAKANQKKALAEQEKAAKAQQAIETVQQASSLVTASAKIWSQLGFPLALVGIGVMFGSFLFSKIKAAQLAKRKFSKGDYVDIGGGSHASGNDTVIYRRPGEEGRAERGESLAVFNAQAKRKYGRNLPKIVNDINRGTFNLRAAEMVFVTGGAQADPDPEVRKELRMIRKQGEERRTFNPKTGQEVIYRGNTIIRIN